jgi:Tfp pilus assembly protein PilN
MIRINLLADRHAKDRFAIQQQLVFGVAALIGSIILCGFWWQAMSLRIDEKNESIKAATVRRDKQRATIEKVKKMETRKAELDAVVKAIEALMEFKHGPTPYLDDMNVMLPSEIWFTSVVDAKGQLTLQGYSFANQAVAKLMKALGSSMENETTHNFSNVELRDLVRTKVGAETLMKFNIQCMTSLGAKLAEEENRRKLAAEAAAAKAKADLEARNKRSESQSGEGKK